MNKRNISYLAFLGLLGACATSQMEHAERSTASIGGYYTGPQVDVNIIDHPPAQYAYCDRYASQTAKHVLACAFGLDEASRMAERFGGGHGRIEGYLRGYAWGLYKGIGDHDDDNDEMVKGAAAIDAMGGYMATGIEAGKKAGTTDGSSRGGSDARARFYNAVDKNIMPSPDFSVPAYHYEGERNAYTKYVGKIQTAQDILNSSEDFNAQVPVYNSFDKVYLSDTKPFRIRDLWFEDGVYKYERSRWYDKGLAFSTWLQIPLETKAKYTNLNVDAPVNASGTLVVDYKAVFQDAFLASYDYYVNYAFSKAFHENLDEGQRVGEGIGTLVGKRVAYQRGLAHAFDVKFEQSSVSSYGGAFSAAYASAFNSTYSYHKNNAILDLKLLSLKEEEDDGVLQPGERFGVQFKLVNVGAMSAPLKYSVNGDVSDAQEFSDNILGLKSRVITSDMIARIDPRLNARDTANVILRVNSESSQLGQVVNRLIELKGSDKRVSILDGAGQVQINLQNISKVQAAGTISLDLFIDGKLHKTVYGSKMGPGSSQTLVLDFQGLDPLAMIMSTTKADVVLKYNDAVFDRLSFSVNSGDKLGDLGRYFDRLANEKAVVPNGVSMDDRLNDVKTMIFKANIAEVAEYRSGKNVYRKSPEETIIGKMLVIKSARIDQSSRALSEYLSLAESFAKESKKFKSFLGIHPKRTAYMKLCSSLAGKKLK